MFRHNYIALAFRFALKYLRTVCSLWLQLCFDTCLYIRLYVCLHACLYVCLSQSPSTSFHAYFGVSKAVSVFSSAAITSFDFLCESLSSCMFTLTSSYTIKSIALYTPLSLSLSLSVCFSLSACPPIHLPIHLSMSSSFTPSPISIYPLFQSSIHISTLSNIPRSLSYPPTHPPSHIFKHPSKHPSKQTYKQTSKHPSIHHPTKYSLHHRSSHPFIHPSCMNTYIHLCPSLPFLSFINPSINLSIHPSNYSFLFSIRPFTHLPLPLPHHPSSITHLPQPKAKDVVQLTFFGDLSGSNQVVLVGNEDHSCVRASLTTKLL